jgi:hypothetical protein
MAATFALLLGFSFLRQPAWAGHFLAGAQRYTSYANVVWPFRQVRNVWLASAIPAFIGGLIARTMVIAVRSNKRRDILLTCRLLVILSLAVLPQTGSYSLTMHLIPPMGFLALSPNDRWVRAGVLASLVSPWLYWWLRTESGILTEQLALPLQFALIGARVPALQGEELANLHRFISRTLPRESKGDGGPEAPVE